MKNNSNFENVGNTFIPGMVTLRKNADGKFDLSKVAVEIEGETQTVAFGECKEMYDGSEQLYCTNCKKQHRCLDKYPKFCPNCGAFMKNGEL